MAQIPDDVKWVLTSSAAGGARVPKRWVEVAAQRGEQRVECSRQAMQGGRAAGGRKLCVAQFPDSPKWGSITSIHDQPIHQLQLGNLLPQL